MTDKEMNKLKKEFINNLVVPTPILFNLDLKEAKGLGVRFHKHENSYKINSIYLENIKGLKEFKNKRIILKFKYKDSDYIKPSFIFDRIYLCEDGFNEIGYDKDFKLKTRDLVLYNRNHDFSKPLYGKSTCGTNHAKDVIKKWRKINEYLESIDYKKGFVSAYKIEKDNKPIDVAYLVCPDKINIPYTSFLNEILDNLDYNHKFKYVCKCDIIKNDIIKDNNIIYIKL